MNRHIRIWQLLGWLAAALPAGAQALASATPPADEPKGDGLAGAYYTGVDFGRQVLTRRDTLIDFNWRDASPASNVPPKDFAVRWTGWLMPPVSGRYVLRISVAGGVRFWITGRQFLNQWLDQAPLPHDIAVDLVAGQAYPLRLEYGQYAPGSPVVLAWELPTAPKEGPRASRKAASSPSALEVIPTRYLFSGLPRDLKLPPPVRPANTRPVATRLAAGASPAPRRVATIAARLAAGQELVFKSLYFTQGKSLLLPSVRASLDTLVLALAQRPTLRLEVQGHTDNQGDPALNRQLSQQRAEAVCRYLAAHGVAAERLRPVGYGGSQPVADNRDLTLRAQNRRVVLRPLP